MDWETVWEVVDTDAENEDSVNENAETSIEHSADRKKESGKKSKPKIHRPCPFCFQMNSALTRHLKAVHKNKPSVIRAKSLPKWDHIKPLTINKQGIYKFNKKEMPKENPSYIRERLGEDDKDIVLCTKCKGCYSKKYRARHQLHCGSNSGQVMIPLLPVETVVISEMSNDFKQLLNSMIIDEIGKLLQKDGTHCMYN